MRIFIPRNLKEDELGTKQTQNYTTDSYWWNKDGNPVDLGTETVIRNGTLSKIKRNKKTILDYNYTYIYEYNSEGRDPQNPEDLKMMIIELMTVFNVHEFALEEDGGYVTHKIEDYYLETTANVHYYLDSPKPFCSFTNKDKMLPKSIFHQDPSSLYDTQDTFQALTLSKDELVASYFFDGGIDKKYRFRISLAGIQDGETVDEYRDRIAKAVPPKHSTIEEAIEARAVSIEDIISCLQKNMEKHFYSGRYIPESMLKQILEEDSSLVYRFNMDTVPVQLLKKYRPEFCNQNVPVEDDLLEEVKALGGSLYYSKDLRYAKDSKLFIRGDNCGITVPFNEEGIKQLKEYIVNTIKENEEQKQKEEQQKEKDIVVDAAKQMGYPSNRRFEHLPELGVDQADAIVIRSDGSIRPPDSYEPRTRRITDGIEVFDQVFPGEIILQYYRPWIDKPYQLYIDWADREVTGAQLATIEAFIKKSVAEGASVQDGFYGPVITDLRQWAIDAVKNKAEECRKELKDIPEIAEIPQINTNTWPNSQEVKRAAARIKEDMKDKTQTPNFN